MNFKYLQFEQSENIATLTINRPRALNALNQQTLTELKNLVSSIHKQKKLRALIIRGADEKAFSAGADIKEMLSFDSQQACQFSQTGQQVFSQIESLPIPVIASVYGFALGGGLELALACDIILISDHAKLGLPETSIGLLPAFGGTQRLLRAVGFYKAKEMIFSGQIYPAKIALSIGLANQISPQKDLMTTAWELAKNIEQKNFEAVRACKTLIHQLENQTFQKRLQNEAQAFGKLFDSPNAKEGIKAFIEKRPPHFKSTENHSTS